LSALSFVSAPDRDDDRLLAAINNHRRMLDRGWSCGTGSRRIWPRMMRVTTSKVGDILPFSIFDSVDGGAGQPAGHIATATALRACWIFRPSWPLSPSRRHGSARRAGLVLPSAVLTIVFSLARLAVADRK
jgi:hypothetical protein